MSCSIPFQNMNIHVSKYLTDYVKSIYEASLIMQRSIGRVCLKHLQSYEICLQLWSVSEADWRFWFYEELSVTV